MMAEFIWTPEQKEAIETVDRSVLVAAAAGSGKTAVLAGRCAHLVCDAPPEYRCDVDRLLVVTFTEAAAAEMKERIRQELAQRSAAAPHDRRLHAQIALLDTAQISTLHAFCLWMVRRWFHRAGVDATAQLLDEDEARLLRRDALDALFDDLYAGNGALAEGFHRLVEDYGLGYGGAIADFVLRLAGFLVSLADPEEWLERARDGSAARSAEVTGALCEALLAELRRQEDYCAVLADSIARETPDFAFYGDLIHGYAGCLCDWRGRLERGVHWEVVRTEIAAYALAAKGAPRLGKDAADELRAQRDRARDLFKEVRENLLAKRLQAGLCRFSAEEIDEGFRRVAPYAATFADLAAEFIGRFEQCKRALGVMDFSDLERLAYKLLSDKSAAEQHSPVALELRARFVHVLVDEYQDINPLQARLLSLVSREDAAAGAGNLFAVGDVKQSIYRFRLAEPAMFLERRRMFDADPRRGACLGLQRNYRSQPTILEGVNAIFRRLMQSACGDIAYDADAELRAPHPGAAGEPIELHLLERRVVAEEAEDETRFVDVTDPTQWRSIEREAFLIATRVRALMDGGMRIAGEAGDRPLRYKDVCILLRSTKHSARPLASMLNQRGVPTWTDASEGLFSVLEVREVLSLLAVLDNTQQDIPLAAVLRSGILGEPLDEDDLCAVRIFDREGAFHEAVRAYANRGPQGDLRQRLTVALRRVRRYRAEAHVRPLAELLWMIYRETGYLAFVGGMPGGEQRRANLIALHERARQFGQFRRQGLRRFLHFIETLQDENQDLGAPSALGEADDVVRIMSIHKAKGIEFPVVVAAELGRRFNLSDSTGRFLFDRRVGIGIKAVDRRRLIEYPTALYNWCARDIQEASLAEEMRVWYVALTRARWKLILVGSEGLKTIERLRTTTGGGPGPLNPLRVLSADSPLHWVVGAMAGMPGERVTWNKTPSAKEGVHFEVTTHDAARIRSWTVPVAGSEDTQPVWRAVARLDPLPDDEPLSEDTTAAEEVLGRLDYAYPHLGVSSIRAARAASEAKRPYADAAGSPEHALLECAQVSAGQTRPDGARRGQIVHTALQFLRLDYTTEAAAIAADIRRLVSEKVMTEEEAALVDLEALAWFFSTDLGSRIRAAKDRYHRECMFLSTEPVATFDPTVSGGPDDGVLVRGVVDGVLATADGVEIVDYKTDRVSAEDAPTRAANYQMQMRLYSTAVAEVFGQPVTACHLVFLHCRKIIAVEDALK